MWRIFTLSDFSLFSLFFFSSFFFKKKNESKMIPLELAKLGVYMQLASTIGVFAIKCVVAVKGGSWFARIHLLSL